MSPAVRDLSVSSSFYEQLGFAVIAGEPSEHWLILANGEAKIGLFQG